MERTGVSCEGASQGEHETPAGTQNTRRTQERQEVGRRLGRRRGKRRDFSASAARTTARRTQSNSFNMQISTSWGTLLPRLCTVVDCQTLPMRNHGQSVLSAFSRRHQRVSAERVSHNHRYRHSALASVPSAAHMRSTSRAARIYLLRNPNI